MEDLFTLTPEPETVAEQGTSVRRSAAPCSLSVLHGDARNLAHFIQPESVDLILTSPPYYRQRDYGVDGQIGMEPTVTEYIEELMKVFNGLRNALKSGGNLLINVADSYATSPTGNLGNSMTITGGKRNQEASAKRPTKLGCGVPEKSLFLVPERLGLALLDSGWIVRQTIIWHKPNAMPSSVRDRCHMAHEVVIHATKAKRYFFDASPLDSHEAGGWDECCPDCEGEGCDRAEILAHSPTTTSNADRCGQSQPRGKRATTSPECRKNSRQIASSHVALKAERCSTHSTAWGQRRAWQTRLVGMQSASRSTHLIFKRTRKVNHER